MKEQEKKICSVCGAEIVGNEVYEFGDKVMCKECFEGGTTTCDCCGVRIWSDDAQGDSGITLCDRFQHLSAAFFEIFSNEFL